MPVFAEDGDMKASVLGYACVLASAAMADAKPNTVRSPSVLSYLGSRGRKMAAKLPPLPADVEGWRDRREQVRKRLSEVLGLPRREPMKAEIVKTAQKGGLVFEDVIYLWAERAYVSARVVRPKGHSAGLPAIVQPPGWVEGVGKRENFTCHMARKGYLMIVVDDPHAAKRKAPCAGLYGVASAAGTQVMGVQVFDNLRALDYLLTRPDVDPGRIGICGLCQGAEQTWLAAALDERFKVAAPVCGTTTYEEWVCMPALQGRGLSDPSPYVANVLRYTDWHEIGACIVPRPVLTVNNSRDWWWPLGGYRKVVATMKQASALHGVGDHFQAIRRPQSHDFMPFCQDIEAWFEKHLKPLPRSKAARLSCARPVKPDFSMLRYFQRRIARQGRTFPARFETRRQWDSYRKRVVSWLDETCDVGAVQAAEAVAGSTTSRDDILTEVVSLPLDGAFRCGVTVYSPKAGPGVRVPGVIFSHGDRHRAGDGAIVGAARKLAGRGYVVVVPEHASTDRSSRQYVARLIDLYGCGDTVGLSPMSLRVWDNRRSLEYLLTRGEVDPKQISIVGVGVGGLDACLCAVLDGRVAGVASLGATTVEDWAKTEAQHLGAFSQVMPYLPGIAARTDLQYLWAAVAPRPLLLVRPGRRPGAAVDRVSATCRNVYDLLGCGKAFVDVVAGGCTEALAKRLDLDAQKHLVAAARAFFPPAPVPGEVGMREGLTSRSNIDTTPGIVWVVTRLGGCDQDLAGPAGRRVTTWSLFNDNGSAQRGRKITPLVFRKEGNGFKLTGIGTARTNTGTGAATHDFGLIAGIDAVGKGYYFGWHTGDPAGHRNAGVVEYDDQTADRMTLLTLDGRTGNQKVVLGTVYKVKLHLPPTYSIQARATEPSP